MTNKKLGFPEFVDDLLGSVALFHQLTPFSLVSFSKDYTWTSFWGAATVFILPPYEHPERRFPVARRSLSVSWH